MAGLRHEWKFKIKPYAGWNSWFEWNFYTVMTSYPKTYKMCVLSYLNDEIIDVIIDKVLSHNSFYGHRNKLKRLYHEKFKKIIINTNNDAHQNNDE